MIQEAETSGICANGQGKAMHYRYRAGPWAHDVGAVLLCQITPQVGLHLYESR
jgi:hypothetical protein